MPTSEIFGLITGATGATVVLAYIAYLGLIKRAIVPFAALKAEMDKNEKLDAEAEELTTENTELKVSLTRAEERLAGVRERLDEANGKLKRIEDKTDTQTRMLRDVQEELGDSGQPGGTT